MALGIHLQSHTYPIGRLMKPSKLPNTTSSKHMDAGSTSTICKTNCPKWRVSEFQKHGSSSKADGEPVTLKHVRVNVENYIDKYEAACLAFQFTKDCKRCFPYQNQSFEIFQASRSALAPAGILCNDNNLYLISEQILETKEGTLC